MIITIWKASCLWSRFNRKALPDEAFLGRKIEDLGDVVDTKEDSSKELKVEVHEKESLIQKEDEKDDYEDKVPDVNFMDEGF